MALPIQDGGLIATRLQKLLGIQGRVRVNLEEFILPTIQVADLGRGALPPERRHVSARFDQAAVIAESCVVRLEAIPSTILVVTDIHITPIGNTGFLLGNFTSTIAAPPNIAIKQFTDNRLTQDQEKPAGVLAFGTQNANLGIIPWMAQLEADIDNHFQPEGWVVGSGVPGQFGFLELQVNIANTRAIGSIEWDEYQLF